MSYKLDVIFRDDFKPGEVRQTYTFTTKETLNAFKAGLNAMKHHDAVEIVFDSSTDIAFEAPDEVEQQKRRNKNGKR